MTWRGEVDALIASASDALPLVVVEPTSSGARCRNVASGAPVFASQRDPRGGEVWCRPDALPLASGKIPSVALSFVGCDLTAAEREATLRAAQRALAPNGVLFVIDHNRPRRRLAAFGALLRSPRVLGASPRSRWRRLAYPAAREVKAAGFAVDRMRLAAGERVQVIVARKCATSGTFPIDAGH